MDDLKKLIVGFVSKTLKLDETAVASELFETEGDVLKVKDSALTFLTLKDADRINLLNTAGTEKFQSGYQKAKKEDRAAFEKEIKDKYGFTTDKIGVELIDEIIASKQSAPAEINEELVKKHPAFISREKALQKEKDDAVNDIKTASQREKSAETFTTKSLGILKSLKPVLPSDAMKAENQLNLFKSVLANEKYEVTESGDILLLDEHGNRRQDAHGHSVDFTEYIKAKAESYFDFEANDGRSSGGDPKGKGAGTGGDGNAKKPANKQEYLQRMNELMLDQKLSQSDKSKMLTELQEISVGLI